MGSRARLGLGLGLGLGLLLALAATTDAWGQGRAGADTEEGQTFEAAEKLFAEKSYDEAAKLYEKVISINPQHSGAYVKRGVIFYIQGKYSSAVGLLRKAQQLLPDDLDIKAQLGLSLYKSGATDMAVEIMEEVTSKKDDAVQVHMQLGQHYLKVPDGKKAASAFERYFKFRPEELAVNDAKYRFLLGNAYLLNTQFVEAQKQFELTLKVDPSNLQAKVGLGAVYAAKSECSRAITLYQSLLSVAAQQPSIYFNMAKCYVNLNRKVEAEKYAAEYIKAKPHEVKGFILLGTIRLELRNAQGALDALQQARTIDPNSTQVQVEIGKVYIEMKNYKAAIEVLEGARRVKPDDAEIQTQLLLAYVPVAPADKKLWPTVTELAEKLSKSSADDALMAAGLGSSITGDDANAEKAFTAAIGANPRNVRARTALMITHNRLAGKALAKDDLASAETSLLAAQKIDAQSVQTLRNLGLVQLLAKKYAEAEKTLLVALQRVPTDLVVNRLLARVYIAQKRNDDALKAYQVAEGIALRSRGNILAEVYCEMGPLYLELKKTELAVSSLEEALRQAGTQPVRQAALRNLSIALYSRGLERMKDAKQADAAFDDLTRAAATPSPAVTAKEVAAMNCAAGIAALKAGRPKEAQDSLGKVGKEGCTFNAPYDKVGLEFFTGFAQYRDGAKRDAAAKLFNKLLPKATGGFRELLNDLIRSSYEHEAYQHWTSGDSHKSATALASAKRAGAGKRDSRILDHDLAVIDLADGRMAAAEKVFEALAPRPPEALANLGIIKDREGDSRKALDYYKQARDKGSKGPLKEWINSKERLLNK